MRQRALLRRVLTFQDSSNPAVFLQCGSWVFPLVPGRSPVLKTEDRTFMIPDINLDREQSETSHLTEGKFPTVGLVFSPEISEGQIKRFERILKCYSDYRHYTPVHIQENDMAETSAVVPTAPSAEEPETQTSIVPVNDGTVPPSSEKEQVVYNICLLCRKYFRIFGYNI